MNVAEIESVTKNFGRVTAVENPSLAITAGRAILISSSSTPGSRTMSSS